MHAATTTLAPHALEAPARPLPHLMRSVWIQALRRNDLYVVAILMGLYVLAALVLRLVGIESPQVARFVAGLGLQLASTLAAVLVIVMAARQVPEELEQRTIYPVLAKPVARWQFLLGKGLPMYGLGVVALFLFSMTTLAIAPRLPYQEFRALAQALLLKDAELAMLTSLTVWLSLWMPVGVVIVVAATLDFFGAWLGNFLAMSGGEWGGVLARLIPDFALFDQFQRYVNGGASLALGMLLALLLYAVLWTTLFSGLACLRFQRMQL